LTSTVDQPILESESSILDKLIDHLKNNTTEMADSELRVPTAHFIDPDRLVQEREVFKRKPLVVAHHSEISEPGSFITRTVLGTPLLIVRQRDGGVRASLNVCRHRGGTVESEPCGKKRVFTCNYHGWTYDRDGSLRHIPYSHHFEPLDRLDHGLIPVSAEEVHGLIWITLEPEDDKTSVKDYLGPQVDAQFSKFNFKESALVYDFSFDLDVNWKLVMDGSIDSLHPKFLHPYGVGKLVSTNVAVFNDYGLHGELFTPRMRLEEQIDADENLDPIRAEVADGKLHRYCGSACFVFPNTNYIRTPDHVEFWTVWPHDTDPSKSTAKIRFLADPNTLDDKMRARISKSWEILKEAATEEDWPMEESIQENAPSVADSSYLYARNEISCQHLHIGLRQEIGD